MHGVAWAWAWLSLKGLDRLSGLTLILSCSLSGLSLSLELICPNTIHPWLSASFSPRNRPPFRVGFAGKLLPVSGYAWTPISQGTVVVSSLGFVEESYFEVSGPHRTFLTKEIGLLWLFGILLLLFHSCLVGCGS